MNKGIIFSIVGTLALIALFSWGYDKKQDELSFFRNSEIYCLNNGHQNIYEHIHPKLKITVDGENEIIPANIGIDPRCMSEIHTHDETGEIHAESIMPGRVSTFNLGHFFEVWEKSPERDGYNLEIIQDGEIKNSVEDVAMIDHSQIELRYTSN